MVGPGGRPQRATQAKAATEAATEAAAAFMTIGALAQAAGVGVETVRYYQRRGLLPQPSRAHGAVRRYPPAIAARLRFIRRAQQLGFTLDEIVGLLQLADGTDRRSVRRITAQRLAQLQARVADLQRMADALEHVLRACEHGGRAPRCPIIEAIEAPADHDPETASARAAR
jgi:MerR family mercuric resistance operon transcriptional regulator